jgi:hypothetical protein
MQPLYFIGDSNVMIFSHLSVAAPEWFAAPFIGRSLYCPTLSAADIVDAGGAFDERFAQAMAGERLVVSGVDGKPYAPHRLSYAPEHALSVGELLGNSTLDLDTLTSPPLVLMVGALDLAWILGELGPNTDFFLNDPRYDGSVFEERAEVSLVPGSLVREMVRMRLARFGTALRMLAELGFEHLYVHSITPPTSNDARYYRWRQIVTQASVRSKVVLLLNARLEEIARESGARFLDLWDATAERGVLAGKYVLDGDHFNKAAALLTFERVLDDLANRAPEPTPVKDHPLISALGVGQA